MAEEWEREQPEFAAYMNTEFCQRAERAGLDCKPCFDHICDLKGRAQRRYEGYDLKDTIMVYTPRNGEGLVVETDIEVPFPMPEKYHGGLGVREIMKEKHKIIDKALQPELEELRERGVNITAPWYHNHYNPNVLPEVGAVHIHVLASASNHGHAKSIANSLRDIIDANKLEDLIK